MIQSITDGKRPIITVARVVQRDTGDSRVRLHAGRVRKSCGCKRVCRSRNFTAPLRVVDWPPQYESDVSVCTCTRDAYKTTFGLRTNSQATCVAWLAGFVNRATWIELTRYRTVAGVVVRRGLCGGDCANRSNTQGYSGTGGRESPLPAIGVGASRS